MADEPAAGGPDLSPRLGRLAPRLRLATPLVTGLVHFAEAIDAMLIAEGVETVAERDALLRLGVRYGQGFLLGRPAPAAAVLDAALSG
jgi:EAL domain-containing protein (putative c-di-GMP-specific phosphodiesterase class I)